MANIGTFNNQEGATFVDNSITVCITGKIEFNKEDIQAVSAILFFFLK